MAIANHLAMLHVVLFFLLAPAYAQTTTGNVVSGSSWANSNAKMPNIVHPETYEYFNAATSQTYGYATLIERWQNRVAQQKTIFPATLPNGPSLARDFTDFYNEMDTWADQPLEIELSEITHWIQSKTASHYISDGDTDKWAVISDVWDQNGDDCDGLNLLSYYLLKKLKHKHLGHRIYIAIIAGPEQKFHMVTLWFTPGSDDPLLIDPTGVASTSVIRTSISGWRPLYIYDEKTLYKVDPKENDWLMAISNLLQ